MSKKNEKIDAKELAKKLLNDRTHGAAKVGSKELEKADEFAEGYKSFMDAAKTERETVTWAVQAAEEAGFVPFDPAKKYKPGDKVYYNNRGKAMCLAVIGKKGAKKGVRIAAAHIDSPRIDLKPIPLYESNEMALLKTHYYGGIKKYQWTAIPLSLHGKIVRKDGDGNHRVRRRERGRAPVHHHRHPAPPGQGPDGQDPGRGHLRRGHERAGRQPAPHRRRGRAALQAEHHEHPAPAVRHCGKRPDLRRAGVRPRLQGRGHRLRPLHDWRLRPRRPRLRLPHPGGHLPVQDPRVHRITVLADKEEIGSVGNTGLASEYLNYFVADLAAAEGLEARHVYTKSTCLSADVTAAYRPQLRLCLRGGQLLPILNRGVGLSKYTGSRGKGGSNDANAEFVGQVRKIFDDADVLWQIGELGKVDQGGGGTVALDISRMNADVIDVGVPVLSMHSPFEVVSKLDVYMAYKGFKAYFEAE